MSYISSVRRSYAVHPVTAALAQAALYDAIAADGIEADEVTLSAIAEAVGGVTVKGFAADLRAAWYTSTLNLYGQYGGAFLGADHIVLGWPEAAAASAEQEIAVQWLANTRPWSGFLGAL